MLGRSVVLFLVGVAMMLVLPSLIVHAADVTAEDLIERVPVLSLEDERIPEFQFTWTVQWPTHCGTFLASVDIEKTREDQIRVLLADATDGIPIQYMAEGQSLIYNAARGTVYFSASKEIWPRFVLRATDSTFHASYGYAPKEKSEFLVDMQSVLKHAPGEEVLTDLGDGRWQIEWNYESEKGVSVTTAVFNPSKQWPLESIKVTTSAPEAQAGDSILVMSLANISINSSAVRRLPAFPSRTQIPSELRVTDRSEYTINSQEDAEVLGEFFAGAYSARAAIVNSEKRTDFPGNETVNWLQAVQVDKVVADELRRLTTMRR